MTDTLSNASCCSLTTDMWTGCHSRSYMAVTAHIVSDDWEMKSFCLVTREVTSAHTADNIAAELSAIIAEWKLDTQVIGITTDNARNVKNAVDSLEFTHFGCIGHTLQLSINRGLQLGFVSRVLGHVRKLVEHFHKSTKATYALRQKQKLLGVAEHTLVQQCETRWSSTFAMLERVVEQQQALCAVLLDSQDRVVRSLLPDGAEWSVIEELMVILKPFALATMVLSGSSYGTISIVSPLIHKFCSNRDRKEDDGENLKQIKVAIQSDLKERYVGDTAKLLQEAAFLDPRFKQLNFLSDDERRDTIERTKVKMLLAASDKSLSCEFSEAEPHQSCSEVEHRQFCESTGAQPPKKKKKTALNILFNDDDNDIPTGQSLTNREKVETELLWYSHEETLDLECDPLEWWKVKSATYPNLSAQVQRMWSLPASSVRSEEIFSTAGNILTLKRNRLLPEHVNMLVFLHANEWP